MGSLLSPSDDSWKISTTKDTKQHNNQTIGEKNTLEVLFRVSDNIPHHYSKLQVV